MQIRRVLGIVMLMMAPILTLIACGNSAAPSGVSTTQAPVATQALVPTQAPAAAQTTVRVGYVPVLVYAPLYVGIERGYFKDEGITIESLPIQGGSEAVVQLAAGNFDAALGGAGAGLFNAAARGVSFAIVAPMHSERPPVSSPLVISAKRVNEIKSIADLKGKKVSINATGAATEYWLAQALAKGGLTMNDIQLTTVPFPQVPAALESGALDAGILGEPLATINQQQGLVAILSNDFIDGFYATYLYMGDSLLKQKPELAAGFMRAYLRACRDMQGNYMTPEIAQIVEKYTKVPAAVVEKAALPQYNADGTIPIDNLETLQTYFRERKLLEYANALDIKSLVNTKIGEDAAKALGKP